MERTFIRSSNKQTYKGTFTEAGTLVTLRNVTTDKDIPLFTDTARDFKKGKGFKEVT